MLSDKIGFVAIFPDDGRFGELLYLVVKVINQFGTLLQVFERLPGS